MIKLIFFLANLFIILVYAFSFRSNIFKFNRKNNNLKSILSPAPTKVKIKQSNKESKYWEWRGQKIRYIVHEGGNPRGPAVLLVHGLFVNADHFRKNLPALAEAGYRAYAIDLLGSGYSSKPSPCDPSLLSISGENGRADVPLGLNNIELGTARGGSRVSDIQLAHPLGSIYNFYTWAEQLTDFAEEIIKPRDGKVSLICNSKGTIPSLQAAIDRPDIFDSCLIINPTFRELHVAESPVIFQPLVRGVQTWLRKNGQPIFNALATPETVKNILKEPYAVKEAVTDELVDVLLSPLLQPGSADVVFDTLSYSTGPLPEQQLQDPALNDTVVEICYGDKDPWTPLPRVQALSKYYPVKSIEILKGVGHCPHDEAPNLVNPLLIDFLNRVNEKRKKKSSKSTSSKLYEEEISLSEGLGPWLESKLALSGTMRLIGMISIFPILVLLGELSTKLIKTS